MAKLGNGDFSLKGEVIKPYKESAVVQVIPWSHHENAQVHEAVVEFIRKIPKNSVLFIEESPFGLDFLGGLPQLVKRKNFGGYYFGESHSVVRGLKKEFSAHPNHDYLRRMEALSSMEIIEEARRRNLRLVPLDTSTSRISISRAFSLTGYNNPNAILNFVIDNYARDAVFAKQVAKEVPRLRGKKVFALCGTVHVPGLVEELANRGISSRFQVGFFSEHLKREIFEKIRVVSLGRRFI